MCFELEATLQALNFSIQYTVKIILKKLSNKMGEFNGVGNYITSLHHHYVKCVLFKEVIEGHT